LVSQEESAVKWPTNILIWNLRKPLPFPDSHFDCLYASHLLEHLYHNDGLALLKEGRRVLRPGGVIRIAVPDLQALAEDYVGDKSSPNGRSRIAADQFQDAMLLRAKNRHGGGLLRSLYSSAQDLHSHKWLYDEESLFDALSSAGFGSIRRCQFLDSKIDAIRDVEDESRVCKGNLCMEGEKG
jgi:predicted SAM-dependent methyltransferase